MSIDTKSDGALQAIKWIKGEIAKRLGRCMERLPGAVAKANELLEALAFVKKSQAVVEDMGPAFTKGVKEVLDDMYGFYSGYSSNGQDVVLAESVAKASDSLDGALVVFGAQFPDIVALKGDAAGDAEALGKLRALHKALVEALEKAIQWEATGGQNPTVTKDPFQSDKTLTSGSVMNIAAQNAGPSAVLKSDDPLRAVLEKAEAAVEKSAAGDASAWPYDLTSWISRRN